MKKMGTRWAFSFLLAEASAGGGSLALPLSFLPGFIAPGAPSNSLLSLTELCWLFGKTWT